MTKIFKIGIVILIQNQLQVLDQLVLQFEKFMKDKQNFNLFVVVESFLDISTEVFQRIEKNDFIQTIQTPKNMEYNGSIKFGLNHLSKLNFDWAVVMNSNMTDTFEDLSQIYISIISDNCDYIKVSRDQKSSEIFMIPCYKRFASRVRNLAIRFLCYFTLSDPTSDFRALRLEFFRKINVKDKIFSTTTEELFFVIVNGGILQEIPTTLGGNKDELSKCFVNSESDLTLKHLYWMSKLFKLGPRKIRKQVI